MNISQYLDPLVFMSVFIALDVLTGVAGAFATGAVDSSRMRSGLFHKLAFYFAFALAVALEVCASRFELGISVPAVGAVVVYIISTEVVSILENICIINPDLKNNDFLKLFGKSSEK